MGYLSDRDVEPEGRAKIPRLEETQRTLAPYDRISAFLNSATETTYSEVDLDPFQVYMKNLNSDQGGLDASDNFISSMGYELSSQTANGEISPSEAVDVSTEIGREVQDPEHTQKIGTDIVAGDNPNAIDSDQRINKIMKESLESKGTAATVWEYAKSILIPGRDPALDYEMFGKIGIGGAQENFVNNFHSLDEGGKEKALGSVLRKMESVDGYWLEKVAFLQDLTSDSPVMENQALRQIFVMMDAVGVLGDVAVLGKMAGRSSDMSNALKKSGNPTLSGQVNAATLQNPQAAANLGTDRDMAFLDTLNTNRVLDTVNNAAAETLQATGRMYDPETVTTFQQTLKTQLQESNVLKPQVFTTEELTNQADKFVREQTKILNAGVKPNSHKPPNYDVVSFKDDEITIKVDYGSGEQLQQVKVSGDAWGVLEQLAEADHTFKGGAKSPKFYLRRMDGRTTINRMVEDAGLIETTRPIFQDIFGDAYAAALGHAGKFKRGKVERALKAQDDEKGLNQSRLFSPEELEQQFGMAKKQIDSYYMVNSMLDTAGDIEAYMRFKKADLAGVKEVDISATDKFFGRSYETNSKAFQDALTNHQLNGLDKVYDPIKNKMVKIDGKRAQKDKNEFVILDSPEDISGIGKIQVMLVPKKTIKSLRPESMSLHRVGGYIPRIREDAKYFVKEDFRDSVNGKEVIRTRTYAGASTKGEAEKLRQARQADIDSGKADDVTHLSKVVYDREGISPSSDSAGGAGSGLFTGHRATHDIVWGGVAGERMEPLRAIAKNLQHVSTMYPSNEWKLSMVERWKNTVRASNTAQKNDTDLGLHTPIDSGTAEGRQLEAVRQYISGVTGIPDEETLQWEGLTRALSERMDSYKNGSGRFVRRSPFIKDPVAKLKYLAFQSLLGWFNPAQLFVQATNLATALSIHPWLTARHMNKAMALRAILDASDDGLVATAAKRLTLNPEDLIDIKRQFKRAGLDQIQTNADMDAAIMGFGTGGRAFRKAANAGLIFYRNGELASRTVSYVVARHKHMRDNKIKNWNHLTDKDHREIKESFDNLSLNLGKENKASFQRGILSLPTQFWHVQTKFVEQFFGKKFTAGEKVRLALGQAALFGTAGIPFGSYLAEKYANYVGDDSPVSEDFVRQGMMSWISSDIDLAGRGGIPNQLTDQIMSIWDDTNDPMWEKMMGASGILFTRGGYAFNLTQSWAFDQSPVDDVEILDVIQGWAGMVSTVNNAEQAISMSNLNKFINKRTGSVLFNSPTNTQIWAKAMGFQSTRERRVWELKADVKSFEAYKKNQVDRFFQHMYSKGVDVTTVDFSAKFARERKVFLEIFSGGDSWMRQELDTAIWSKITKAESEETRAMKAVLKKELSDSMMNAFNINYSKEELPNQ